MNPGDDDPSFFEKERDRLVGEITGSFEVLISESNILNRKLEEILGVGKEFETISALWGRFHQLVQEQQADVESLRVDGAGMPGTGGHVVAPKP
ncbi:hypothetical protein BOTBODRAFT_164386 [Botryobasidium botryosum FD-172 SS1]|uniref:DASH complex subunit DAD1 n=1 Tax=Botryobasidium botryosum (strain FD-172 SS1) TaxID=930990 RepID=A0A067M5C1_BOTB1|nr:hypothetical protein BOTBODRAFT_164386 [Botryobasidium botryosum FD-172 SS1]